MKSNVFCKDCQRFNFNRFFKIHGCKIGKKWFFVGLNRYKECAYYRKKGELHKDEIIIDVSRLLFKVLGFCFCYMVGYSISEWVSQGEPESGWISWRPFLFIALSVGCFILSKLYSKKAKGVGDDN